jgi:Cu-Zn family superoxide dismutase
MIRAAYILISLLLFTACNEVEIKVDSENKPMIKKAVAVLQPLNGSDVTGIVYFNMKEEVMEIIADVEGLPQGDHGFHIHEFGDLRINSNRIYVGGHFNPDSSAHGGPIGEERHAGDLGNIYASAEGMAHYKNDILGLTINGANSILGRSIVIHEFEDDFETQPAGNAGKKIAVGVIGIANTE